MLSLSGVSCDFTGFILLKLINNNKQNAKVFAAMIKWFIEAPNSILDTEKAFLKKKRLSSRRPLSLLGKKNRDTASFVVEFISILIFNINYQVLTKSKNQDFMIYETTQVYTGFLLEELLYGI